MADTYSYIVAIMYIYYKKQDATDCLESLVLSYLHYSLYILNKTIMMTTCDICYNLNLLYLNSKISQKLSINNKISITTTNI